MWKLHTHGFCSTVLQALQTHILLYNGLSIFRLKEFLDYEKRTNMKNECAYFQNLHWTKSIVLNCTTHTATAPQVLQRKTHESLSLLSTVYILSLTNKKFQNHYVIQIRNTIQHSIRSNLGKRMHSVTVQVLSFILFSPDRKLLLK